MSPQEITTKLLSLGFAPGDQNADLGLHREWLIYLVRSHGTPAQYQCLWLTTYDDRFVEALLQVYSKPFNSRARPPMVPIHCALYRRVNDVMAAVEVVYSVEPLRPGKTPSCYASPLSKP